MARALQDILSELETVYAPQKDLYNKQIAGVDPMQQADVAGLEQAKVDSFKGIETQANRRGMFYSGVPIAEQAQYIGTSYLPALANVKNKYAQIKGSLMEALAGIGKEQYSKAYDIRQKELDLEEAQRQAELQRKAEMDMFYAKLAADQAAQAAASRASGGSSSSGGLSGLSSTLTRTPTRTAAPAAAPTTAAKNYIGNNDYRGRLAYEASKGDRDANVALKYVGNDGRYDGAVSNLAELETLRRLGIQGNYYVPGLQTQGSSTGGLRYL